MFNLTYAEQQQMWYAFWDKGSIFAIKIFIIFILYLILKSLLQKKLFFNVVLYLIMFVPALLAETLKIVARH